ncbi:hypothetical protein LY76DRAFT_596660 [Colletotrichum caudatum]|nr:hypothetical protein LY76DRAFT_596660 [Colletotrichum caudatum]
MLLKACFLSSLVGLAACQKALTATGQCEEGNTAFCGQKESGNEVNSLCAAVNSDRQVQTAQVTADDTKANEAACVGKGFADACTFSFHCVISS